MNEPIKLIRLNTGEDIITQITKEKENSVEILNPMTIFFKRLETGKALILMSPWFPIEIVSDNITEIDNSNILCMMNARTTLIQHYIDTVEKMSDMIVDDDELELASHDDYAEDNEEEYDVEEVETLQKKKLH